MREEYLDLFYKRIESKGHLIGVAAGSGMTAKYAIMGGCDFIMALSSGKYRSMGISSMAGFLSYANSNDMVMEYATHELLRTAHRTPVFFGYNATDPTKHIYDYILEIKRQGFDGLNNYPTVGMIDGHIREALEEAGFCYEQEVEAIHFARYCGLLTIAYVFTPAQARMMTEAGADIICAHFGLTSGGYLGPKRALSLEQARRSAEEIFRAARDVQPGVICLVYGGPVKTPMDAQYIYKGSLCQGFIGGSSFERIPVETAILNVTRSFCADQPLVPTTGLERIMFNNPGNYNYAEFVREYIEEAYMNEVRLSELASALHLSAPYLSSLFRRETGCSFRQYLLRVRMEKARSLIRSGDRSLAEVARDVGYTDYAQFSKTYKTYFGISPRSDFTNIKKTQLDGCSSSKTLK